MLNFRYNKNITSSEHNIITTKNSWTTVLFNVSSLMVSLTLSCFHCDVKSLFDVNVTYLLILSVRLMRFQSCVPFIPWCCVIKVPIQNFSFWRSNSSIRSLLKPFVLSNLSNKINLRCLHGLSLSIQVWKKMFCYATGWYFLIDVVLVVGKAWFPIYGRPCFLHLIMLCSEEVIFLL